MVRPGAGAVLTALLMTACTDPRAVFLADARAPQDSGRAPIVERYTQGGGELDLLLVIDDSAGMAAAQQALVSAFGPLLRELDAQRLSWRVGVISTDLGISPYAGPGCAGSGKGASLQSTPRKEGCTGPARPWLSAPAGGDPTAALGCIAELGESGCGFERPMQAALVALDPKKAPAVNAGFLREAANLLVVFLSSEDDCSASDASIYDPDAADLGPWASYRCFEHDVGCSGTAPDGTLTGCSSGKESYLLPVREAASGLQRLRPRGALGVLVITGPPQPVRVGKGPSGESELEPSCSSGGISARPAIRLSELRATLGPGAQAASICEPDVLRARLREAMAQLRQPPYHCLVHTLRDPAQPGCSVEVIAPGRGRWSVAPSVPGSAGFRLIHPIEPGCSAGALSFDPGALPPDGAAVELRCDFLAGE